MAADSYTSILGLILQGTGNNDNTWGENLNNYVIQYIEDAIAGRASISMASGDVTLSAAEARASIINATGTLTANRNIVVPNASKSWIIRNATSGSYTLSVKTSSGSAVELPQGGWCRVWCDGSNVVYVGLSNARMLPGDGTVALPAYSFASDTDSGLYRIGANNLGIGVNATKILDIGTTGLNIVGDLYASGDFSVGDDALIAGDLTVNLTATIIGLLTGSAATLSGLLTLNSTAHMLVPRGTTAQRSGTTAGSFRYNTSTGYPEYHNGTDWVQMPPAPLPRGYIDGCILSNGTDTTNDIDIAAGVCRDSTNAVNMNCPAMTKQLDANWVAGTNQGFRNSAAGIANTTYYIHAVATAAQITAGTCDYYAHTSPVEATALAALQAESGGSSYLYARRIGAILRESAAIVLFTQTGNMFLRKTAVRSVNNTGDHSSAQTAAMHVPVGIAVEAILRLVITGSTSGQTIDVFPADFTSAGIGVLTTIGSGPISRAEVRVRTNTSAQIKYQSDSSGVDTDIYTMGWIDARGANA